MGGPVGGGGRTVLGCNEIEWVSLVVDPLPMGPLSPESSLWLKFGLVIVGEVVKKII